GTIKSLRCASIDRFEELGLARRESRAVASHRSEYSQIIEFARLNIHSMSNAGSFSADDTVYRVLAHWEELPRVEQRRNGVATRFMCSSTKTTASGAQPDNRTEPRGARPTG